MSGKTSATLICLGDNGNGSAKVDFFVDGDPPTVTLTQAPINNALMGLAQPLVLSGSLSAYSPSTVTFAGSSLKAFVGGSPGSISGPWEIDVDTETLLGLSKSSQFTDAASSLTTIGVYATDFIGLVVTYSTDGFSDAVDPTLARQIYIDSDPPIVTFDLVPSSGSSSGPGMPSPSYSTTTAALAVISGSVSDNFGLSSLAISIQDSNTNDFWQPKSSAFVSALPILIPLIINGQSEVGPVSSPWVYNGVSDRNLVSGHTYVVTALAYDLVNNASTTTLTINFIPPGGALKALRKLLFNTAGIVSFSPENPAVQWGGYDAEQLTISVSPLLFAYDPAWQIDGSLTVQSDDGALALSTSVLTNSATSVGFKSAEGSCFTSGWIDIAYNGSVVSSVHVSIQAPTSSAATRFLSNQSTGITMPANCTYPANQAHALFCRGDFWNITFPGETPSYLYRLYALENQGQSRPLTFNGARLKQCINNANSFFQLNPEPINTDFGDLMAYTFLNNGTGPLGSQNCGDASIQTWEIISLYQPSQSDFYTAATDLPKDLTKGTYATCSFVTNIQKTQRMDWFNPAHIHTTRSDCLSSACADPTP